MTLTLNSYRDFKKDSTEVDMAKGLFSRWHRYDANGVKYIRKFPVGTTPTNDEGFSIWMRGNGPMSPEHYEKVAAAMRRLSLGVPKSQETKSKMRQAKLGKPKTEQHKKNMSLAQKRRFQRKQNEPVSVQQTGVSST